MKIAILMRGWPGGGKSYKANELSKKYDAKICSADDFFMVDGKYDFDVTKLYYAHEKCYSDFVDEVISGNNIIVDNCNINYRDIKTYLLFLEKYDYKICLYDVSTNSLEDSIKYRSNDKYVSDDTIKEYHTKFYANNVIKMAKERHPTLEFVSKESL